MLFNDDVMFIHVPKTGGMSITNYLLNNLPGQIHLAVPQPAYEHALRSPAFSDVRERLRLVPGTRHEDLSSAERLLREHGRSLESFKLILAVMRNPYDLEVSYYCHLKKESVRRRSKNARLAMSLAAAGDFEIFARRAPYYGHLPSTIERYYLIDGRTPGNMQIIRLEDIEGDIPALASYSQNRWRMPHHNRTDARGEWRDYITATSELAIFDKYRYLFSFYPREFVGGTNT